MNLYEVYTKGIIDYSFDAPPEPCDYWGIVIHETRGKAKYMGYKDFTLDQYGLAEFTEMKSRLIIKDVEGPARVVTDDLEYNLLVCQKEHKVSNCEECEEECT